MKPRLAFNVRILPKVLVLICVAGLISRCLFAREEWYRGLDLEPSVAGASLVMAARVAEVTDTPITIGGKVQETLQQYRFEPVQVLKGLYSREALMMTSTDLGAFRFGEMTRQIKQGQARLLLLIRSSKGYAIQQNSPNFDQTLPLLQDGSDPMIEATKVLLDVQESRDRLKRVTFLLKGLHSVEGPASIPLLVSLQRRALLAAQTPGAAGGIARHLNHSSPAVRETAAKTIESLLNADYLLQTDLRDRLVEGLVQSLERTDLDVAARVAAIDALGAAGTQAANHRRVRERLQVTLPKVTFAEAAAQLRATGRLKITSQQVAIRALFDQLALDAPREAQQAAEWSLAQFDANQAASQIRLRIQNKLLAGLPIYTEILTLGEVPASLSVPELVEISKLPLDLPEQVNLVSACQKISDPRLVPVLAALLDPHVRQIWWNAVNALFEIDTDEAAKALQPHLAEETNLLRKLEIAEFLGRHGIRDGYPIAIEHMSEPSLREQAVKALAAIADPRTTAELKKVLETSHDLSWNSAAVLALGRLGDKQVTSQFLQMLQDLRNPLAPAALIALGDLGEIGALAKVREGMGSRSPDLVTASAHAAGKLLARPEAASAQDIRDRLAALLSDFDADPRARSVALVSLVELNDSRLQTALSSAVRDAHLEGSDLLTQIEKRLRERKVKLNLE